MKTDKIILILDQIQNDAKLKIDQLRGQRAALIRHGMTAEPCNEPGINNFARLSDSLSVALASLEDVMLEALETQQAIIEAQEQDDDPYQEQIYFGPTDSTEVEAFTPEDTQD